MTYLKIIEPAGKDKQYKARVLIECVCGKRKILDRYKVLSEQTVSCGCKKSELISLSKTTHGLSDTRIYKIWVSMHLRCEKNYANNYERYGGRGIKVCKEWYNFNNFFNDMSKSYIKHTKEYGEKNTSIDRIDNNKGYSKNNCKWETVKNQARNRRSNRLFTYNGKTQCLTDWCIELNLKYEKIIQRINKLNWPFEKAITIS